MKELEQWYKQIESYEKLKLKEAQQLYIEYCNTEDEYIKKVYMDKIILGTLYVVYNYLKKANMQIFTSPTISMSDIIDIFNNVWIEKINDGELLNINVFSNMFNYSFHSRVIELLYGNNSEVYDSIAISTNGFVELVYKYIDARNNNKKINLFEILKDYIDDSLKDYYEITTFKYLEPLLENIYNNLDHNSDSDLEITKNNIRYYVKALVVIGLSKEELDNIIDEKDYEKILINRIIKPDFISTIERLQLTERELIIIYKLFGLNGEEQHSYQAIGELLNITGERVKQIAAKTLRKLRHPSRACVLKDFK